MAKRMRISGADGQGTRHASGNAARLPIAAAYSKCRYPSLLPEPSAYQSLRPSLRGGSRSLPAVRPTPRAPAGNGNSVIVPSGVTRPSAAPFVYQTLRSGPTATFVGEPVALGIANSVISPRIVMRPTRLPLTTRPSIVPFSSTNHMLPSAPAVMSPGPELGRGKGNSVTTPAIVMRPILLAWNSENQMLPSGPAASARGPLNGVGISNSVTTPAGVMRPILPAANKPNQMLPSAPSAIARGWLSGVGMRNSVISPAGVMRAIWPERCSENQTLPSAPSAMMRGALSSVGTSNSTRPVPSGFMRPMRLPLLSVNQTVPSGASAIVVGPLAGCGSENSVTSPVAASRSLGLSQRCCAEAQPATTNVATT